MKTRIKAVLILLLVFFNTLEAQFNLPSSPENGVMFHAHRWTFKAIEAHLQVFAESGYNAIQVSPVTRVKTGTEDQWWGLYQPCNLEIGNPLGTYSDFVDLCTSAESYGIHIIVDAVLNHMADDMGVCNSISSEVDQYILQNSWKWLRFLGCNGSDASAYKDRYKLTQYALGALPEWNTQNTEVQDLHIQFLNSCINAGADGFRFDAAKHIETNKYEDYGQPWAGNYWDNVLNRLNNSDNLYLFGEVLPDDGDNEQAYLEYFDITAHGYGESLRHAVNSRNISGLLNINHHSTILPKEKALCYIENHDDFHSGATSGIDYNSRLLAHALLIPRNGLTPRVFGRPFENLYNDPDMVTLNKFRNAMDGQSEYLRFPATEVLIIERGNKGMVVINTADYGKDVNSNTNVLDGTYSNHGSINSTANISNGYLSVYLPARSFIVIGNYSGSNTDKWYFSGVPNEWGASEMDYLGGVAFQYNGTFDQGNGFKIRHSNQNWDECYPENNWIIWEGSGDYAITFYSDSKYIDVNKTSSKSAINYVGENNEPLVILPNPVDEQKIKLMLNKKTYGQLYVKIFDQKGLLVLENPIEYSSEIVIDLPMNLDSGVYMLNVFTDDFNHCSQFLLLD